MRITSRQNAFLQHLRKLLSSAAYGKEQGLFVGDGEKLLQSAGEFPLAQVIFSEERAESLAPILTALPSSVAQYQLPGSLMSWISPMKSPQGVLFVAKRPDYPPLSQEMLQGNYLILDGVQDPGNVGTIWRTAQGLGASALVLLEGCASPWGHKTVRSSMGACFHLPVYEMTQPELLSLFSGYPLYGTALQEESKALGELVLSPSAVVLGSEGQGIGASLLAACDQSIYLPMSQGCQSLNVAMTAGIVLWEMAKQKRKG